MSHETAERQPEPNTGSQLFSAVFLRLLAAQFMFGISFSAFLLLPKFLRLELGVGPDAIGTLSGASLLWAAVVAPFVGSLAKFVARRTLLIFALVLEAGSAMGFAAVTELGPLAYVLRAFQGIAFVIVFNCTSTFAADLAPRGQLARAIGFIGVAVMVTNALAPLIVEPLADSIGWSATFLMTGLLAMSALPIVFSLPKEAGTVPTSTPESNFSPPLLAVYYGSFLMGGGIGVMFTFVQPFAIELGKTEVAPFFLGYVPVALFVRIALGSWADRFGYLRTCVFGMTTYAIVVAATSGLTPSRLALYGAGLGVAHGFLYPALSAAGLSRAGRTARSVFMGWFICAFNTGFALAVLALGYVAKHFGYPLVFLMMAAFLISGLFPLVLTFARSRPVRVSTEVG